MRLIKKRGGDLGPSFFMAVVDFYDYFVHVSYLEWANLRLLFKLQRKEK